jgi:hypothetical protein
MGGGGLRLSPLGNLSLSFIDYLLVLITYLQFSVDTTIFYGFMTKNNNT